MLHNAAIKVSTARHMPYQALNLRELSAGEQLPPDVQKAAEQLAARSHAKGRAAVQTQHQDAANTAPTAAPGLQNPTAGPRVTSLVPCIGAHLVTAYPCHPTYAVLCRPCADCSHDSGHAPGGGPAGTRHNAGAGGDAANLPGCIDAREAAALMDAAAVLPSRANVLVTDMIDHRCHPGCDSALAVQSVHACLLCSASVTMHRSCTCIFNTPAASLCSVLGLGLLSAVDYAATRLLTPDAVIVPARIEV
jgi:hypothetical protein